MSATHRTSPAMTTTAGTRRAKPHAEFMQIWEEGYVSHQISFEVMHTPSVLIIEGAPLRLHDGGLDRIKILAYVEAAVAGNEFFRLRLLRGPLGLTPPAWVPDESFDLSRHVLFSDVVEDRETADLRRLAGDYDGVMDIRHPLWRFRVTELTNGDVALGVVMHHASLDGLSGMKIMSTLCQKEPGAALPEPSDPFAGRRAPSVLELPGLALRQWWARQSSLGEAWRSYWSKPFHRRLRRVAARILLPLRYRRGGEAARAAALPPRHSATRVMNAADVARRAKSLGGTLSDLQVAAMVGAWDGEQRIVQLRFPVSFHSSKDPHVRNHVRDMSVYGDADADVATTLALVRQQLDARDEPTPAGYVLPGTPIGYSTLLPWVSRPRYFCGGEVLEIVPFPASLGGDRLSAAGIMYNGSLFIGATMPRDRDVEGVVARMHALMTGTPHPEPA